LVIASRVIKDKLPECHEALYIECGSKLVNLGIVDYRRQASDFYRGFFIMEKSKLNILDKDYIFQDMEIIATVNLLSSRNNFSMKESRIQI
jgi:predicted HD phosphohydrolase